MSDRVSDETLREWADRRADDAGRLARELLSARERIVELEALRDTLHGAMAHRDECVMEWAARCGRLGTVARWLNQAAHADSDESAEELVGLAIAALDDLHEGDLPG